MIATLPQTTLYSDRDVSPQAWDAFVAASSYGHLLQSYAWGELKARYGWEPRRVLLVENGRPVAGAQVTFRSTPLGAVAYIARGPVLTADHPDLLAPLLAAVHGMARSRRAIFLKAEPNCYVAEPLIAQGFRPSRQTIQAKCTLVVDLTLTNEELLARQKPKTRYNIRLAARKGVATALGTLKDLPDFYRLMVETGLRDGFVVRPLEYYRNVLECLGDQGWLIVARYNGVLVAAIIVSVFGCEAIYLYGASSNLYRNVMATYLVQWDAIMRAKAAGCLRYDLWGVPPELAPLEEAEPDSVEEGQGGLWGVYRFKRGFGGRLVSYPGAFDYVYDPLRYQLWYRLVPFYQSLLRRTQGMGEHETVTS